MCPSLGSYPPWLCASFSCPSACFRILWICAWLFVLGLLSCVVPALLNMSEGRKSLTSQFLDLQKAPLADRRRKVVSRQEKIVAQKTHQAGNPERMRKAKLKLVEREAPSQPGGYYRYQRADCVTFSPLDQLVRDYSYDAQRAVLAYDEENGVEFEVLLIVSMEFDGKVLVRFKGYTEHFDMHINPSDDFKFPGFETAYAAFQKKLVLESNSVSSFEAMESAADNIADDVDVVDFLEMDRWNNLIDNANDNANDSSNLDVSDVRSVGKRKYLISDDEAEEVRKLPSKLAKSTKRSAMKFFSPLAFAQ